MNRNPFHQRRLSSILAAALIFLCLSPGFSVLAEELPSEAAGTTLPDAAATDVPSEEIPEETSSESAAPAGEDPAAEPPSDPPESPAVLPSETEDTGQAPGESGSGMEEESAGFSLVPDQAWYAVAPEDILPTDVLAIAITSGDQVWTLCAEEESQTAPAALPALVENGLLLTAGTGQWQLSREPEGLILKCQNREAFLYPGSGGLRIGTEGVPYWELREGFLCHSSSGQYLQVNPGSLFWLADTAAPEGQALSFWRLPRSAPATASPASGTLSPDSTISLSCSDPDAAIWYALSADGSTFSGEVLYTQPISVPSAFEALYLRVYTAAPGIPQSPPITFHYTPSSPPEPDWNLPYSLYFGQLHAHTSLSDGLGSPADAYQAAAAAGMDFYAVTDHSDSFDNSLQGSLHLEGAGISTRWAAGKAAAAAATNGSFVGLFGFEMSWPQGKNLGHINTFATPGWQCWDQEGFDSLQAYYQALSRAPGAIGQFNHPGDFYGDFEDFSHYSAAYDSAMTLLEVGGEGAFRGYDAYTRALDRGWHVAPASSDACHDGNFAQGQARTVILANGLTEASLYEALGNRRVYATEDRDLELYFTLNGQPMGSILWAAENPTVTAYLSDPTDEVIGTLQVLTSGGTVAAERTVDTSQAVLTIPLTGCGPYYYLKVIQPDGDIAVTAPVWLDSFSDMGIQSFTAGPELALAGQPLSLTLQLFNQETAALNLQSLEFFQGDTLIQTLSAPGSLSPGAAASHTVTCIPSEAGQNQFRVRVTGSVLGQSRCFEETLTVSVHEPQQTAPVLIDGNHGGFGLDSLSRLTAIAGEADMTAEVFTGSLPAGGTLLVIPAPAEDWNPGFPGEVSAFLRQGGSVILMGGGYDAGPFNALLEELGCTMRCGSGFSALAGEMEYNPASPWSREIPEDAFYYPGAGWAILPGSGTWLIKEPQTGTILLACEETAWGGTVFAGSSAFLTDQALPPAQNAWDPVSANQSVLEAILGIHRAPFPLSTIAEARQGAEGTVFRIRGYVTAGTSNPYNTFPDMLCLQDNSGGIPITGFSTPGIQVGAPLELYGVRRTQEGNPVLEWMDHTLLDQDYYRYVPNTLYCSAAMDFSARGGQLLQVEGTVTSLVKTPDGKGISRLTLRDIRGDYATVVIGSQIFSGSMGTNTLSSQIRVGRTVRAMGILFLENGSSVLQVRNCEEVVYVPPLPDPTNPKVGDSLPRSLCAMVVSAALLSLHVCRRKGRRR